MLLPLILALLAGIILLIVLGPVGLNLFGSLLMFEILIVVGVALLGGSAGFLAGFNAQEERALEVEKAQLEAARTQLATERTQAIAQLEAKEARFTAQLEERKAQFEAKTEAKMVELDAREAKVASRLAEETKREERLEAERVGADAFSAETGARYNQLIVEQRRVHAWTQRMEKEDAILEAKLAELKQSYGDNFPKEVSRSLMKTYFNALKSEDPALLGRMLSGEHFNFTAAPKPIQVPEENKIHEVLEQGLQAGCISQDEFDDVLCSISGQVMQDPVIGEDKLTYDRAWLRPIYYQLSGTYPDLKLGTYPLTRHPMKRNPDELPRDEVRYQKIQGLVGRYQALQPAAPTAVAEEEPSTPAMQM